MVKDKFLAIYNGAVKEARETFKKDHLPRLTGKSTFEQVKYLNNAMTDIKSKSENFTVSPYFKNHSNQEWLLKLFASRTALLNVDESNDLQEGVYWGTLQSELSEKYFKLLDSIPKYSYEDFINGKHDPFFFDLGYNWHFKEETDYEKISIWRAEKVIRIVALESQLIIRRMQEHFKSIEYPLEVISKDKDHYENHIFKGDFNKPQELIDALKSLSFFAGYDFTQLDNDAALEDFRQYQKDNINWNRISKNYIDTLREKYYANKENIPFSDAPIIFYSVGKVMTWMDKVLNGTSVTEPFLIPDTDQLLNDTIEKAKQEAENLIEQYDKDNNIESLDEKEVEQLYIQMLDNLRREFNDKGSFSHYFAGLQRDNVIDKSFETNCFFGNNEEDQARDLRKAVILQERIYHYMFTLWDISGKHRVNYPELDGTASSSEVMFLMHNMVLDTDLHDKMGKILDDFMEDMNQFRLPLDLVLRNVHEKMHELFYECINRLLNYLEDSEPANKVLYIQTRLKQLKQRELEMRRFNAERFGEADLKYTNLFKEYLELEADFIRETKDVRFMTALKEAPKSKQITAPEKHSFGFKHKDTKKLLETIKELCFKVKLLNEDITTPVQFMAVLTAKDLNGQQIKVQFDCETTQLRYIIDKLRPYFSKLTLRNIENSKLFHSKTGALLTAQNLSSSKVNEPKDFKEIDKAFTLLQ